MRVEVCVCGFVCVLFVFIYLGLIKITLSDSAHGTMVICINPTDRSGSWENESRDCISLWRASLC